MTTTILDEKINDLEEIMNFITKESEKFKVPEVSFPKDEEDKPMFTFTSGTLDAYMG